MKVRKTHINFPSFTHHMKRVPGKSCDKKKERRFNLSIGIDLPNPSRNPVPESSSTSSKHSRFPLKLISLPRQLAARVPGKINNREQTATKRRERAVKAGMGNVFPSLMFG